MVRISSDRLTRVAAFCLAGFPALACSSSDKDPAEGNQPTPFTCTTNDLQLAFSPMYSAFDGVHEFKIPVIARNASGGAIEWSADQPGFVDIQIDDKTGGAMLTTLKAGTVTIQAKAGQSSCGTSVLTITAATPAQWEAGSVRYNNGKPLPMVQLDANGNPIGDLSTIQAEIQANPPACTNCHGPTATSSFFRTVSHTPQQTGGFTDEEIKLAITNAVIPAGGYFDETIIPKQVWEYFHKWPGTPDELTGLVVYLRALPPAAQGGKVDFGGVPMR